MTTFKLASKDFKSITRQAFVFKFTRSKTWGVTCNIKGEYDNKKLGYAGGYGYDKIAACFSDFIFNVLMTEEGKKKSSDYYNYFCGGSMSSIWGLNEEAIKSVFNLMGYSFSGKWLNKNEFRFFIEKEFNKSLKDTLFLKLKSELKLRTSEDRGNIIGHYDYFDFVLYENNEDRFKIIIDDDLNVFMRDKTKVPTMYLEGFKEHIMPIIEKVKLEYR